MNFAEAEKYLISLGNEVETMKLGLDNIRTLLTALGDPQTSYLKVQIAGTNGKGSVCAFLDSICREAGIRTGLFTSPHLVSITERIRIAGADVSEEEFAALATHVRTTSERLVSEGKLANVPTYFEQVTAMALLAFAKNKVELAILETGLGGRFDATTAANAEICGITRIDLDHQEYLGNNLNKIAAEKAAIIHAGSKAVVCQQTRPAMKAIFARCKAVGVKPRLTTEFLGQGFGLPALGLRGMHQTENAEVAILLAYTLRGHFQISDEAVAAGLENARHPGRLEYQGKYLLDGAHNIGGARALARYLDEYESRPVTLVFAAMNDKKVHKIMEILFPRADQLVLTRANNSRGMHLRDLLEQIPKHLGNRYMHMLEPVSDAIDCARRISSEDSIILITGSLYLVGEVKEILADSH